MVFLSTAATSCAQIWWALPACTQQGILDQPLAERRETGGKEIDALDGWKEFAQKSPIAVTFLNPYFFGSFSTLLNPTFASQMYAFTCMSASAQCAPSDA